MELKVFPDYNELSAAAAEMIVGCVRSKPDALLCFATGDTPKLAYQLTSVLAQKNNVDFSSCFIIGLDEWMGIPPENTGSCHYFLHHYLLSPLKINQRQVYLFNAMTANEEDECDKMDSIIAGNGGIDFVLAGIGLNGHLGFNEPGTATNTMAHVAILEEITKTIGQKYFEENVNVSNGITVGLKQVMQAKTLLMMANGRKKAPVIKRIMEGEASIHFPASLIRQHIGGVLMVDNEAASQLETPFK